jgi:Ca-activated chloride channel homolog
MKASKQRRGFLAVVVFLAASLVSWSQATAQLKPQAQAPTIRVNVDRVNVGVIVTSKDGNFVEGLRREDFRVFDNGMEQPITDFLPITEPAQVVVLIEAGPAVYLLESGHVLAAYSLLSGLSPDDRVAVVKYAEAPQTLLNFSTDKQAAIAALGQLRFNLGFSQLNLTSSLSAVLEWLSRGPGKKTIVLLSTGVDTSPPNQAGIALEQLKTGEIRLFCVSLSGGLQETRPAKKKKSAGTNRTQSLREFDAANQLLQRLAEATGGRAYFPGSAKAFEQTYEEISRLIRHEYSLAFVPPLRDGQMHSITVEVNGFDRKVSHRQAYLAATPETAQK